jgi:hypothetical protein
VRYRTAAVLSVVLIGGMFVVPSAIMAVFIPSLNQGIPDPLPGYEHVLLAVAAFFPYLEVPASSSDCVPAVHCRGIH